MGCYTLLLDGFGEVGEVGTGGLQEGGSALSFLLNCLSRSERHLSWIVSSFCFTLNFMMLLIHILIKKCSFL